MTSLEPMRFPTIRALLTLAAVVTLSSLPSVACAGTVEEATPSQADLIGRMPAQAITIGVADFAAIRDSAFYEFAREEGAGVEDSEDLQELIDRTGMDPRTDLHRVGFVSGRLDLESRPEGAMILVASFDRDRLESSLADRPSLEYGNTTLWLLRDPDASEDDAAGEEEGAGDGPDEESRLDIELDDVRAYLVILDDSTVAIGSQPMLEQLVDVAAGAPSARSSERLMALVEDIEPDSEVWLVSAQERMLAGLRGGGDGPTSQLPVDKIQSLMMSVQLTDGIELELRGRTALQEDAQLLGDSLNGMLAFGKMMLQNNSPEIFAILDESIRAGSGGRDVTVRADLSLEQLRQLREFARETLGDVEEGADSSEPGR